MSNNGHAPGPGAASKSATMGISENREKNLRTAKSWLEKYLVSASNDDQIHTNTNYPSSLQLITEEHVEEDHLALFIEAAGWWLSSNSFWTRQNTWLCKRAKTEFFKSWKEILKKMFPRHPAFMGSQDWWTEINKRFTKHCDRARQEDPAIAEERKSEPLYRDLSKNRTAIQAKFRDEL